METLAPSVVAVIVTCDPGPWFAESLRAFGAQEYPELSVLVLDAGSREDPTAVVAAELPGAFVRLLGTNRGFGASANEALAMVEGASYFLFCHDDVAPAPDAVAMLVEESFRSNAGVVAPKLVSWEDPGRLLHVGMAVDKGGAVVDRVEPGEVDHGQHDAVRDVFLAPGGCTLVRADLFAELGGFDPDIFAMGEDLDLCWRAQIAGARVLVAPQALVRHLEILASGQRPLPPSVLIDIPREEGAGGRQPAGDEGAGPGGDAGPEDVDHGIELDGAAVESSGPGEPAGGAEAVSVRARREGSGRHRAGRPVPPITLQSLQRRHELHAVLKSYGRFHLLRVLPQLMVLGMAEYVVARASGHRDRAAAVAHAWRWNLVRRRAIRAERVAVRAHRRLDDAEVRRLQLRGSARFSAYLRRAVNQGLRAAHLGAASDVGEGEAARDSAHRRRLRADALSLRVMVWAFVVVVLIFGTRQLVGAGFPYVGQLLPLPSAGSLLHRFFSGWQPSGVGTTDPTSPATAVLGVAGVILLGGVGLLQKIVVLGCIPLGAVGMARLVRPLGSPRARLVSILVYLAVPLPYDALATGRWDALLAYAGSPWIVTSLARASRFAPFGPIEGDETQESERAGLESEGRRRPDASGGPAHRRHRRLRPSVLRQVLALGVIEALLASGAPAEAFLVLLIALGLALGSLVTGGRPALGPAGRIAGTAVGATVVAFVLLLPWSASLLSGPDRWQALTGLATAPTSAADWGAVVRLSLGPIGNSPLAWAFLVAAALPLVIGARWRLAWAGRMWAMALVAWLAAWSVSHGGLGSLTPSPLVLLAPAAVAVAVAVGLGAAAFETDLRGYRFGWRQGATVLAAVAATVGVIPVLSASADGRWDLPSIGYGQATSWMAAHPGTGNFRVLWLGDPRVLPGGGWSLDPGLAYSISENGLGDATEMWSGSSPGAASPVGRAIQLARQGDTVSLGTLLAPYAIRYIVVVDSLAPSIPGLQSPLSYGPPSDLEPELVSQLDLRQLIGQGGFSVFVDDVALPERAVLAGGQSPAATNGSTVSPVGVDPALAGWKPVLEGPRGATSVTGRVPAGTVVAAVAPSDGWELLGPGGRRQQAHTIFGYASAFDVTQPASVTVRFRGSAGHGLEVLVEILLWVAAAAVLIGRRQWMILLWRRMGRRRARRARLSPTSVAAEAEAEHGRHPVGAGSEVER